MTRGTAASAGTAADRERERAASARMYGAAEAIGVLSRRGPAARLRAAEYAVSLLNRHVGSADWRSAGLPISEATRTLAAGLDNVAVEIQVSDPAVVQLAKAAMSLRCSTLRAVQRPGMWSRLTAFFATILPDAGHQLRSLLAAELVSRQDAGDVSQEVVAGLLGDYAWRRDRYGGDAYLTSIARTNLANAYRQRAAGTDLADAAELCREELSTRARRYGAEHPFTLVARNLFARCLLAQAETSGDQQLRCALAQQAYEEAGRARAGRDHLYGITSANSTLSRRHQGHALLLLGELTRARACLRYALAFETAHNDNAEWRGSGHTYLLLARVSHAVGDRAAALDQAGRARRLLCADGPAGRSCREAAALLHDLGSIDRNAGTSH